METIVVVDLGLSNVKSVKNALHHLGYAVVVTNNQNTVASSPKIILPGVGSFAQGAARLKDLGLDKAINSAANSSAHILGICLGMQLLASSGSEGGKSEGLGLIDGSVDQLNTQARLPHVGWNSVEYPRNTQVCPLYNGIPSNSDFYFTHSFAITCSLSQCITGLCDYNGTFIASVAKGRTYGVQFHPEKSQKHGLTMLKNFGELSTC